MDSQSPSLHDLVDGEDDPLSYHSDFDYYTHLSNSDSDLDTTAITPFSSVYGPVDLDPRTSPDTMPRASYSDAVASPNLAPSQDSLPWRGHPDLPENQRIPQNDARGHNAIGPNAGCSGAQSSGAFCGAGHDDNNGHRPCRGHPRSSLSSTSDDTSSSDDNADGMTVYYSLDGMSNGRRSRSHSRACSRHSRAGAASDDDIPLAQRVPTALSAQKSIRKQLHDERQRRRLDRAKSSRRTADPRLPCHPTELPSLPPPPTGLRKRSTSTAPAPLPGSRTAPTEPFPVEDLTSRLLNLQTCSRTPPYPRDKSVPTIASPRVPAYNAGLSRSSSRGKYTDHTAYSQQKASQTPETPSHLRSVRSFHRPNGRHSETQRSPVDQTSAPRLGRSATAAASSHTARTGRDAALEQHPKSGRISDDSRRPSATIPRSPIDRENDVAHRAMQRPPVPPLPISDATPPQLMSRVPVVQQRIFIGDMQRFNMVEITPATNAGDVIDAVARQGMLDRSELWMVFELAQDYGMERPIRDYELLADVSASWNKDKLLNAFVIKHTPLARLLSRSALPTSSPTYRGWVEWESKRGKWSKRWMELREHGLWLSKRDTGKDETFLCSLSNFDAYFVTRRHKSPKPFMFAIKSTDHLSLFENAADYLHVFSCIPKDGEQWMQAILVARSYVLYQERNVLFAKTGESLSQAKPLTRSRTRKQSVSNRHVQPLVSVPPPFSQGPTANVTFEPGSLLAKRKGDAQL